MPHDLFAHHTIFLRFSWFRPVRGTSRDVTRVFTQAQPLSTVLYYQVSSVHTHSTSILVLACIDLPKLIRITITVGVEMIRSTASRLVSASLRAGGRGSIRFALATSRLASQQGSNRVLSPRLLRLQQSPFRLFSSVPADEDESGKEEQQELFENLDDLHPTTLDTLSRDGITVMTEIQSKTWHAALEGSDVIGRSRTGSGKTLAFLLPSIERLLREETQQHGGRVRMLIVSPTRELANQIDEAAKRVTAQHPSLSTQVFYGGVPKHKDMLAMNRKRPTILTATPGRLLDHLENSYVGRDNMPFAELVKDIDILVLDEMDRYVVVKRDAYAHL